MRRQLRIRIERSVILWLWGGAGFNALPGGRPAAGCLDVSGYAGATDDRHRFVVDQ
jgi:hypothetical protein